MLKRIDPAKSADESLDQSSTDETRAREASGESAAPQAQADALAGRDGIVIGGDVPPVKPPGEEGQAALADRSGIVIGGAVGQQPPEDAQAQTSGEPGTTAARVTERPNIRLKRTGTVKVDSGRTEPVDPNDPEGAQKPVMVDEPVYARAAPKGKMSMSMNDVIEMPDEDQQRAGWYEKNAQEIINQFPDRYVAVIEKGAK
jgi:hypothetical protein